MTAQGFDGKYMTKLAFAYEFNIPYSTLADRIRRGEIPLHFIDNKIQINVTEALKACKSKRPQKKSMKDLFSAA